MNQNIFRGILIRRTDPFMKTFCLSLLVSIVFVAACSKQNDVSLGNGFVLRSYGSTIEMHAAKIALWLKMDEPATLVWPSLNSSCGGPILIERGILFTARNQENEDAVFAADEHGIVAEITSYIPEVKQGSGLRQINKIKDKVQIDFWGSTGNPQTTVLTGTELIKLAKEVISKGKKVRLDKVEFYQ